MGRPPGPFGPGSVPDRSPLAIYRSRPTLTHPLLVSPGSAAPIGPWPPRWLSRGPWQVPPHTIGRKSSQTTRFRTLFPDGFFHHPKPDFRISAIGHTSRTLPAAFGKYPPTRSAEKVHKRPVLGPFSPMGFFTTQNQISGSRQSATPHGPCRRPLASTPPHDRPKKFTNDPF